MDRPKLKQQLILVTYAILLFLAVYNLPAVLAALAILGRVLTPVIIGFAIAFLLNIPFKWFRKAVFYRLEERGGKYSQASIVLAIIAAYTVVGVIVGILIRFIIPQVIDSLTQLLQNIPYYVEVIETYTERFIENFNLERFVDAQSLSIWAAFNEKATQWLTRAIPTVGNYVVGITSGLFSWLLGIVISIYFLYAKDALMRQLKLLLYAFGPQKHVGRILELAARANLLFNRFIAGDLIDAVIVGIACFIGTSIMQTPYALLVSVIVGVTNIIPIFGPFIGAIPSLFLIVIVDPFKALLFLIFITALQQIDGNIVKPHVFGNTLGLPSLWVLVSIVVGGGLFGIMGMILGVPTLALLYSIIKEVVHDRLKNDSRVT